MASSESNAEHSDEVAVVGFGLNKGLNKSVPLLNQGAEFVSGDVHTVEVGIAIHSFNFVDLEFELSPGLGLRLVVAVSQGDVENTPSQAISSHFLTSVFVTWGQSDLSLIETWGKYVVPLFSGEWVDTKKS